jgi:hypothetical protein
VCYLTRTTQVLPTVSLLRVANDLGLLQYRDGFFHFRRDLIDLACDLTGQQVPEVEQLINLIEGDQITDRRLRQERARVDHQLLGLLNDGTVAAANMAMDAAAQTQTRHDVHAQIDLIRQIGVAGNGCAATGTFKRAEFLEAPLILIVELTKGRNGTRRLV